MSAAAPSPDRRPVVTVILTCYNHEPFVERALDAIKAQTYRPIELVVTDDASSDSSADRIAAWLEPRWPDARFIRHRENAGLCRTLNEAMPHVHGEYVVIASADDWSEPDRIERQVAAFEAAPDDVGLVYSGVRLVDGSGAELALVQTEPGSAPSGNIYRQQIVMQTVLTPGVMVRRSVYDAVGPFVEDDIVEDYDMWLRICRSYRVQHLPAALANFRWHSGNTTTRIHGAPYDDYVAACLRRQLGHSEETDRLIHERLRRLQAAP